MTTAFRLILRALLTWALEAAALYLMLRYLPGVTVVNRMAAGTAILAIGLLNALIRPAILFGAANLGVVRFQHGARELDTDAVQGEDPLAGFSPHTGRFLRRLARYANAGDIIVNGAYDPRTGQIIGIDDLVGAHRGVGGMQTQPFLVYPAEWTEREPELVGAASVHRFLRQHALGEGATPDGGSTRPGAAAINAERYEPPE